MAVLAQVQLPEALLELWLRVLKCVVDGYVDGNKLFNEGVSRGKLRHFQHEYGLLTYDASGNRFAVVPDIEVSELTRRFSGFGSEFDYTTAEERTKMGAGLTPAQVANFISEAELMENVNNLSEADKLLLDACIDSVDWSNDKIRRISLRLVNKTLKDYGIKYDREDLRALLNKIGLPYTKEHKDLVLPKVLKDAHF